MRNSAILIILLIVLLGSSKNDPDKMILSEKVLFRSQDKIKFENVINIGSEDVNNDDYFSMIVNLRIDDKNNIYVLDSREFSLKIFSLSGSLTRKIDLPRGQGPGDFVSPRCLAIDNNRILIGDEDALRVSVLDSTGKYLSSIRVDEEPGKIEIHDERIFITAFSDISKKRVHVYDLKSGEKITSFFSNNPMTREVARYGETDNVFIARNRLYFSCFYPYEIQACSLDGQVEMKLSRIHEDYKKKLKRDPVTNSYRFVIGTAHTLATQSGHIINILKQRDVGKKAIYSVFDIFDPDGKWLTSFSSTDFGEDYVRLADINQQNLLIVDSVEPYPRVRVFFLKIL